MGYRVASLPMTLSEFEGHFFVRNLCNTYMFNSNIAQFNYNMFTHK